MGLESEPARNCFRLPGDGIAGRGGRTIGDAVAPRTLLEAILEARRAVLALG